MTKPVTNPPLRVEARKPRKRAVPPVSWRVQLAADLTAIEQAKARMPEHVKQARDEGASWADIAAVLNVSRQAAQQQYGPKPQPVPETTAALFTGEPGGA